MPIAARTVCIALLVVAGCERPASKPAAESAAAASATSEFDAVIGYAVQLPDSSWCLRTTSYDIRPGSEVKLYWADNWQFRRDLVTGAPPDSAHATVRGGRGDCGLDEPAHGRAFSLAKPSVSLETPALVVRPATIMHQAGSFLRGDLDGVFGEEFAMICTNREGAHFLITNDTLETTRARWYAYVPYAVRWGQCSGASRQLAIELSPPLPTIIPREFPDYEAHRLPRSARWLTLRQRGSQWMLAGTAVVEDSVGDCGDGMSSVLAPSDSAGWILLLANVPGLKEGTIESAVVLDSSGFSPYADSVRLVFRGDTAAIRREDSGAGGSQVLAGYRLYLEERGSRRLLYETDTADEAHWRLIWAGDLDRDGRPDLLLAASNKYSVHPTDLYLSSRPGSEPTQWKPVASHRATAC